jgi:hypothetical protein
MKTRIGALAAITALALAGCGGSGKSHAQTRACWRKAISAYAKKSSDAIAGPMGAPSDSALTVADANVLANDAVLYSQGRLTDFAETGPQSRAEETAWLAATQKSCGTLT